MEKCLDVIYARQLEVLDQVAGKLEDALSDLACMLAHYPVVT